MRTGCRIFNLLVLLSGLLPAAQAEPSIFMPAVVPTPVRHAHNPYLEVVDRSIYPKATSKPVTLQWPKIDEKK